MTYCTNAEKKPEKKERNKLNPIKLLFALVLVSFLIGCADIAPPTPSYILKRPLGTDRIKPGMTKAEVKELWGEPDQVNQVKDDERWGGEREEWVYVGSYSDIPVQSGYLFKTRKLYFDGENLTNITEE